MNFKKSLLTVVCIAVTVVVGVGVYLAGVPLAKAKIWQSKEIGFIDVLGVASKDDQRTASMFIWVESVHSLEMMFACKNLEPSVNYCNANLTKIELDNGLFRYEWDEFGNAMSMEVDDISKREVAIAKYVSSRFLSYENVRVNLDNRTVTMADREIELVMGLGRYLLSIEGSLYYFPQAADISHRGRMPQID